ncbi:MAG: UDP-N-acetylglucosamine 2-epimerase [Deltaproteobacteria bacterium RBG_16_48_10]|nr:MAG: UDP-N-acetylglucosamine 2-epimerase [Deltaproteobacteria bacterium RBG_16_48_10]
MKIVTIIGARPQFIKAAAVSRAIQVFNKKPSSRGYRSKKGIQEILVHTGQHYDYLMDRVFFEELKLHRCDYHLGVGSRAHGKQTGMMLDRIEPILQREKADAVLVYGDTNSTLAGALAAAKMNIPVAHVEAGLRSYDRNMPEEINRVLTDHLSTLLFCPTDEAVQNLLKEGIPHEKGQPWVKNVGDVMYDSILYYSKLAEDRSTILKDLGLSLPHNLTHSNSGLRTPNYYLATLHRAENTDNLERLKSILKALEEISDRVPVILPLHPRTKKVMGVHRLRMKSKNVKLIEPVSYLNMLKLEKNAKAILTDSGGVQKEACWLRVPCVTLRGVTEWGYTVKEGWNTVSGWKTEDIVRAVKKVSDRKKKKQSASQKNKPASEEIVQILLRYFGK